MPTCVICVLDEDATDAVHVDGNARITAAGDIAVNSSASPAVNASGNARITGTAIGIVGDTQRSGNARLSPAPTQVDPAGDPLASLVAPDLGEAAAPVVMAGGNSRRTIGPGTYRSIIVGGNARLTLEPGVYVITEGITVSGNGRLLGDGVVLYLACGGATSEMCAAGESGADLALSGNGRYELTAPTSGDYDGVAVFADRNNAAELSFRSNQGPSFTGTLYARSAHLSVEGNSRLTVEGARLVVATIDASGNARITVE